MTDITAEGQAVPLGVGDIVGSTFSIYFGRFLVIVPLAMIPAFASDLLSYFLLGVSNEMDPSQVGSGRILLASLFSILGTSAATGFVILAAYDARLGRSGGIGQYVGTVLRAIVPIVLCTIVVGIGVGIGAVLLLVPGLWLYGVWCVVVPAIVIERAGFASLGRSAERGYRWPCIGTLLLIMVCFLFITVVARMIGNVILGGAMTGFGGVIVNAIAGGLAMGLSGVSVAMIYARLREIKEGTSLEQIVEVFA